MAADAQEHLARQAQIAAPVVEALELNVIRAVRAESELLDWEAADSLVPNVEDSAAGVEISRVSPTAWAFTISYEEVFRNAEGTDGARIAVDLLAGFIAPSDFEAPEENLLAFVQTTVLRVTYPFYREAVSSLLARIGVRGPTLGLIKFPPSASATNSETGTSETE